MGTDLPDSTMQRRVRRGAVFLGAALLIVGLLSRSSRELAADWALRLVPLPLSIAPETSWVSLGDYNEFEPTRFEQLPESVRVLVDSLLEAHVGAEYRQRLQFVHGQVVDHSDSTARAFTQSARWPVFAYRLGFALAAPARGVQGYVGYVTLFPNATRPPEIAFPPVRTSPERAVMVPLRAARDTAARHGVYAVRAALEFDAKEGAFHYLLTGRYRDSGMTGTEEVALVNAHTGRFIRKGVNQWIE